MKIIDFKYNKNSLNNLKKNIYKFLKFNKKCNNN